LIRGKAQAQTESMSNLNKPGSSDQPPSAGASVLRRRSRTPRILYLTPHWPYRAAGASEARALNIARALQRFAHLEVVVVDGEGGGEQWALRPEHELEVAYSVPVHLYPNDTLRKKLRGALNPRVNYPHGCGVDEAAMQRVLRSAEEFDVLWFCKLRTPNMFPRWAWPRSVADIDDVPSTFEQSALQTESAGRQRLMGLVRYLSWRRRDRQLNDRFSVLGVCSENDKRYLQALGVKTPLHVIPNGFERPAAAPVRRLVTPPRIGFIGIFDYSPNVGAVQWFVRECWPRIKQAEPSARLRLVGRFSDGPLKPVGPDIDGLGWMEDVTEEIATWSAMIVPIQVGAGTRGKIAHAFSLKCPVVSTSLGAYGYDVEDGCEMQLADTADGFADGCLRAIGQPEAAAAMAERAWQRFLEEWTWDAIRPRIWAAAADCLHRSEMAASGDSEASERLRVPGF
jgi:glycosyltransferase involved in cell wall biosynthesis